MIGIDGKPVPTREEVALNAAAAMEAVVQVLVRAGLTTHEEFCKIQSDIRSQIEKALDDWCLAKLDEGKIT